MTTQRESKLLEKLGQVDTRKLDAFNAERNKKADKMLADLMDNLEHIESAWDYDFITGGKNNLVQWREDGKNLSDKQYEKLLRIYNKTL